MGAAEESMIIPKASLKVRVVWATITSSEKSGQFRTA